MRKFSINCDFGGQLAPFDIFIGQPEQTHHPLHFQADWLLKQRGGTILPEVMDAIAKLNTLALENGVPLEDLCVYALGSAQEAAAPAETTADAESNPSVTETESQTDGFTAEESSVDSYEAQAADGITTSEAPDESSNKTQAVDEISASEIPGESSNDAQAADADVANTNPSETTDSTLGTAAELPTETLDAVATPTDTQENSDPQKAKDASSDKQQGNENKQ